MDGRRLSGVEVSAAAGAPARPLPSHLLRDRRVTAFCLSTVVAIVGWTLVDRSGVSSIAPQVAAVGIVVGIPHGAVDHLVPGWAWARWATPARMALVVGVYVLVAALATVAMLQTPDISFAVFILISALHFGWAEVTYAVEREGDPGPRWPSGAWEAVAHGAVVVVLPLWSAQGRMVLEPIVPALVDRLAAVPQGHVIGAVCAICGLTAARLVARRQLLRAGELLAVLTLFLVVPALAAFGVYFGLWHAVRHTSRLLDVLGAGRPAPVRLVLLARASALPSTAALVALALLWLYRFNAEFVLSGVSVLLALTFPHVVVVAMLDRYRRLGALEARADR